MDPAMAFRLGKKTESELFISYKEIVKTVVYQISYQFENCLAFDKVKEFYSSRYECENLERKWPGFDKIT